jgi:hypothetical protein
MLQKLSGDRYVLGTRILSVRADTQAFICFLNTYVLFNSKSPAPAAKAAPLKMEEETQHRLGGAFQAATDRYTSDLEEAQATQTDETDASKLTLITSWC